MVNSELYYDTLINSLIFSPDINNDLKIYCSFFKNNSKGYLYMIERLEAYLNKYNNENIFDSNVKNNIYEIVNYVYSNFPYMTDKSDDNDRLLLNDFLNSVKRYLNNCSNNNTNYIREQILICDYGVKNKLNPYWRYFNQMSDDAIGMLKDEYYVSISKDILFINLLNESRDNFYHSDFENFTLDKDFYRSINYLWLTSSEFRLNNEYYERINLMIRSNLELLTKLIKSDDFDDEEFIDIHNVSLKLLKIKIKKY